MEQVIQSEALDRSFDKTRALAAVDIQVKRGEIFGFLGPNGAGKTTFVKILLGFIRPDGGSVRIFGESPAEVDRARIGYLPEIINIHSFLTAREFMKFQARLAGISKNQKQSIESCLERVKIVDAADRRVAGFSKGMKQRLGLAQAMLGEPELLILDEPNSGLDPIGVLEMREAILQESRRGATVFLNSHQLLEVEKTCNRVAILDHGRVVAMGTQQELTGEKGIELELEEAREEVMNYLHSIDPGLRFNERRISLNIKDDEQERLLPAKIIELGGRLDYYARKTESLEDIFKRVVNR